MSKQFSILITVVTICFFINGCALFNRDGETTPLKPEKIEDFTGPEKVSAEMANKIIDRVMKGYKEGNYDDFSYRFASNLKDKLTKKNFKEMHKAHSNYIGEYQSKEYLGVLNKGLGKIYLWKGKFSKHDNNDYVIRLHLVEIDQAVQVLAFGITPF